jgi:histone H3/H4
MLNKRIFYVSILIIFVVLLLANQSVLAETWEFGTSGKSQNPFTPRGYVIVTNDGTYWLNSRFDNRSGNVSYSGITNGIDYIDAAKVDGSTYTLYAFCDRNPKVYRYLIAYQNGEPIKDFINYIGAPGRLTDSQKLGSGANWAIPIEGFKLMPGTLYEFAFLRGMQANNGITLVLAEDGKGYIKNPSTKEEIAKYEADRHKEYEFISSYWVTQETDGEYHFDFHLVPMRFTLQTYADLSTWQNAADEARAFLLTVTPTDISAGTYKQINIDNLELLLEEQGDKIERVIKKQLQEAAEESMLTMVEELNTALSHAKSSTEFMSDIYILEDLLKDATALYNKASKNIGKGEGQYGEARVKQLKQSIDAALNLTNRSPQTMINNAIKNIKEAQVRLLNTVVRKKSIILAHEASGVKIIADFGSIPEDTVLHVDTVKENIVAATGLEDFFGDSVDTVKFYDIKLFSGDIRVQPTSEIGIQILVPEDLKGYSLSVYAGDYDPPLRLNSLGVGNYRILYTEQAGVFALTARGSAIAKDEQKQIGAGEAEPPSETVEVTVVKETDLELDETPDQIKEELEEAAGLDEKVETVDASPSVIDHGLLDQVHIPVADLRRSADPLYMLIVVSLLVISAFLLAALKGVRKLWEKRKA